MICSKILNYLPTSTYDLNQKVQLGPTDSFHPEPPSSVDIATASNPNQFGLTDRDLVITELRLQTLSLEAYDLYIFLPLWQQVTKKFLENA